MFQKQMSASLWCNSLVLLFSRLTEVQSIHSFYIPRQIPIRFSGGQCSSNRTYLPEANLGIKSCYLPVVIKPVYSSGDEDDMITPNIHLCIRSGSMVYGPFLSNVLNIIGVGIFITLS